MNEGRLAILLPLLTLSSLRPFSPSATAPSQLEGKLRAEVRDFDNNGKPLIPTLVRIAERNQIPLGIERVVKEALETPVTIHMREGTVAALLDLCVRQIPGYRWVIDDGAINICGEERRLRSNIFNEVIPFFEVQNQPVGMIQLKLGNTLIIKALKPQGIIGDFMHPMAQEKKLLSLRERNATVRRILNRIVVLHGRAFWIARVPPKWLGNRPGADSFEILPISERNLKQYMLLLQGW